VDDLLLKYLFRLSRRPKGPEALAGSGIIGHLFPPRQIGRKKPLMRLDLLYFSALDISVSL